MRVLLLGDRGFIGSALHRELQSRDHLVVTPDSIGAGDDISDIQICERLIVSSSADVVVNLVGRGATRGSASVSEMQRVNVVAAGNVATVIAGMSSKRPHLVHCGSSLEPLHGSLPESAYAATKGQGSARVAHFLPSGPVAFLRLGSVYGPGMPKGRLVSALVEDLSAGVPIHLDWPDRRRDFCFIEDVVGHIASVVESGMDGTRTFVVRSRVAVRLLDLAHAVADLLGASRSLVEAHSGAVQDLFQQVPDQPSDAHILTCDTPLVDGLIATLRSMA